MSGSKFASSGSLPAATNGHLERLKARTEDREGVQRQAKAEIRLAIAGLKALEKEIDTRRQARVSTVEQTERYASAAAVLIDAFAEYLNDTDKLENERALARLVGR